MTDRPKRVQLSRKKDWRMPENTVKVDRSNKVFGNPFAVVALRIEVSNGLIENHWTVDDARVLFETKAKAAAYAVEKFKDRIMHEQMATYRGNAVAELRGKNLACWCPLDKPCHADVLLELANTP
jgi:hypothetical protein